MQHDIRGPPFMRLAWLMYTARLLVELTLATIKIGDSMTKKKSSARKFRHSLATDGTSNDTRLARTKSDTEVVTAESVALKPMSSRVQHMVDELRADFNHFTTDLGTLVQSRMQLAPKFMKAFRAWASEQPGPDRGKFTAFVRVLDPSVPEDRDGYRKHSSYQAAENLRSLEALAALEPAEPPKHLPATPMTALSRVVAMILPTFSDESALWGAFRSKLHWNENQIERLQAAVKKQRELVKVTGKVHEAPRLKGRD